MKLTGHLTESIYRWYAIVSEADLSAGVAKLATLHESDRRRDRNVVALGSRTVKAGARDGSERVIRCAVSMRENGGGRGIRTPMTLAGRWISSSYGPCPHHVVVGRHRYLSCLCVARSPG
jgi:hypothetical protein